MAFKHKLKAFFKSRDASDAAVELLRNFILPFSRQFKGRNITVDDVLSAFFSLDNRKFVHLKAKHSFQMPGRYFVTSARAIYGVGPRAIRKGQKLLGVLDKKERTVRLETTSEKDFHAYLLKDFEFKVIEDHLEVAKCL